MILAGQEWFTGAPGGTGTVTITTFTSQPPRVIGTFRMTMQPSQANASPKPSEVTNGQFNIALSAS